MYLADFNSVFQVSVGLHLAYTFLPDLHDFYLRRIEEYANSAARIGRNPPDHADGSILTDRVRYLRYLIADRRRRLRKRIIWMQIGATSFALFSLTLLMIAGFRPRLPVNVVEISLLLLMSLTPMPAFCLYSFVSNRWWTKRIAPARKKVQDEWTRLMLPIIEQLEERRKF
jgi:hypothetical protein